MGNTITGRMGRWLKYTVAEMLAFLSDLLLTGTAEELKQLHQALDDAFTVILPVTYTARFNVGASVFFLRCNHAKGLVLDGTAIGYSRHLQSFKSVSEVHAELKKRTEPSFKYTNLCIVEMSGNTVSRVIEPATVGVKKTFMAQYEYGNNTYFGAGWIRPHLDESFETPEAAEKDFQKMFIGNSRSQSKYCNVRIVEMSNLSAVRVVKYINVTPHWVIRYTYGVCNSTRFLQSNNYVGENVADALTFYSVASAQFFFNREYDAVKVGADRRNWRVAKVLFGAPIDDGEALSIPPVKVEVVEEPLKVVVRYTYIKGTSSGETYYLGRSVGSGCPIEDARRFDSLAEAAQAVTFHVGLTPAEVTLAFAEVRGNKIERIIK